MIVPSLNTIGSSFTTFTNSIPFMVAALVNIFKYV